MMNIDPTARRVLNALREKWLNRLWCFLSGVGVTVVAAVIVKLTGL